MRTLRIAILGTRGIPARYGGFETLAEELAAGLAARGHEVTVYARTRYAEPGLSAWRGAKIRVLPTIPTKYLDTVVHGALSGIDAAFEGERDSRRERRVSEEELASRMRCGGG